MQIARPIEKTILLTFASAFLVLQSHASIFDYDNEGSQDTVVKFGIKSIEECTPNACKPDGDGKSFEFVPNLEKGIIEVKGFDFASGKNVFKFLKDKNGKERLELWLRSGWKDSAPVSALDLNSKLEPQALEAFHDYKDLYVYNFGIKTDEVSRVTAHDKSHTYLVAPVTFSVMYRNPTLWMGAGLTLNVVGYVYLLESGHVPEVNAPASQTVFEEHAEAVYYNNKNTGSGIPRAWSYGWNISDDTQLLLEKIIEPAIVAAKIPWREALTPAAVAPNVSPK